MNNGNSIVRFEDVYFSYSNNENNEPINIIKGVSFDIKQGEYVCIVGHNGSGKSTISKLLSCLIKPSSGKYYIDNKLVDKKSVSKLRKNIGIIFQNPDNQFIGLTTEDDIAFGLENYCVKQSDMKMIIDNAANIINIGNLLKKEAFELSGGQKQKVAITSVIALFPKVIIFDESTSMLDPLSKQEIKDLMKYLQKQFNRTVISITHDMEEIKNADKILCMEEGKVVRFCELNKLVNDYEFLKNTKLDLPFNLKLSYLLKSKGMDIDLTLNDDKLVREICHKM